MSFYIYTRPERRGCFELLAVYHLLFPFVDFKAALGDQVFSEVSAMGKVLLPLFYHELCTGPNKNL